MKELIDPVGRRIRKLRISVVDACDFRCTYCMPEDVKFMRRKELLPRDELLRLAGILVDEGVEEIRLTGGEPTLRPDFVEILKGLHQLRERGLKRLGLTSNGARLRRFLPDVKASGCDNLNISLDSLDDDKFFAITKRNVGAEVKACIRDASAMGFDVKVNAVVQKGVNDDELDAFAHFSADVGVEVRFLEMMKIGVAIDQSDDLFISADDMLAQLSSWTHTHEVRPKDSTSYNFTMQLKDGSDDKRARVGFIASESKPFCDNCSRLRLSPKGVLRPCLMMNEGHSLVGLERDAIVDKLHQVMGMKPTHRLLQVLQPMVQIGG